MAEVEVMEVGLEDELVSSAAENNTISLPTNQHQVQRLGLLVLAINLKYNKAISISFRFKLQYAKIYGRNHIYCANFKMIS